MTVKPTRGPPRAPTAPNPERLFSIQLDVAQAVQRRGDYDRLLRDDPEPTDVVAQVQFQAHGREEQPRNLAAFLAMSVVSTLSGCRSTKNHAQPFLKLCGALADALLGWDPATGEVFTLRQAIDAPIFDAETLAFMHDGGAPSEEMVDTWLRQCLLRINPVMGGGDRRRFTATMKQPRRGGVAFITPWTRNSF